MPAADLNLTIEQGAKYEKKLTWKDSSGNPIDITGYDARMQVRAKKNSAAFLLELTVSNSGIVLGGAAGTIELFISGADTAAITWKKGVYDLELIDTSAEPIRFIEGFVNVSFEVTR